MKDKSICVVGLGYIGLPTAALLASRGYTVHGVDTNEDAVEIINQGKIHIIEPDLEGLVYSAVSSGALRASTKGTASDVYIICVSTPFHSAGKVPTPNIDYVMSATRAIAPFIKSGDLVILESTSPVGTTEKMANILLEFGVDLNVVHIAYCPERVLPGKIIIELVQNDRVVGGFSPTSAKIVADFYRTFVRGEVHETDAKTAEMCKLTENSFRDVNIAFANELSIICDKEGIDVSNLINLANLHPRVNILNPGVGVGGHCIAVDPWFIVSRNVEIAKIIRSAREVNNAKTEWVIEKIKVAANQFELENGKRPTIGCLGLAFKPDIDDLRESPALHIAEELQSQGFDVICVEPNIRGSDIVRIVKLEEALARVDLIAVLVKHKEFTVDNTRKLILQSKCLNFCGL